MGAYLRAQTNAQYIVVSHKPQVRRLNLSPVSLAAMACTGSNASQGGHVMLEGSFGCLAGNSTHRPGHDADGRLSV